MLLGQVIVEGTENDTLVGTELALEVLDFVVDASHVVVKVGPPPARESAAVAEKDVRGSGSRRDRHCSRASWPPAESVV